MKQKWAVQTVEGGAFALVRVDALKEARASLWKLKGWRGNGQWLQFTSADIYYTGTSLRAISGWAAKRFDTAAEAAEYRDKHLS